MNSVKWLPLESNPFTINNFLEKLGVPSKWRISDLLTLDDDYLSTISGPALSVLLLFPFSDQDDKYCERQNELAMTQEINSNLYFMQQSVDCACGTIALIHMIANNSNQLDIKSDALVKNFIDRTEFLSPKDRAIAFQNDQDISGALIASSDPGRDLGDVCNFHYITLVQADSKLYELDGRKTAPVFHGPTTQETFLRDCARVCKEFINRNPDNLNFTALVFGSV